MVLYLADIGVQPRDKARLFAAVSGWATMEMRLYCHQNVTLAGL